MNIHIRATIPNNNIEERKYSIRALLNLIFDETSTEYVFETSNDSESIISINDVRLRFKDALWSKYPKDLSYLTSDNLPKPHFGVNDFMPESEIPIIFGDNSISHNTKEILCGIDVFASVFFMLTRWEEYINVTRDSHNRFPAKESIAYKYGFIERPVVNEYAEMIKNMLLSLGLPENMFRSRKFEVIPTHDIDKMKYIGLRSLVGDIIKRRNLPLFCDHLIKSISNPYDTYKYLMSQSEKHGLKSHFYFMASRVKNCYDYDFYVHHKEFKKITDEICKRGHVIGFHPGYTTALDSKEWKAQKMTLCVQSPAQISEGRQHYLMMNIPSTLQIWEDNNMEIDSTMGYADHIGFRCGTGDSFPVFNFLTRKQLGLIERPLIVMDGTLKQYMQLSVDQALNRVYNLIDISKKYNMSMTILFHNSSFCDDWESYNGLYEAILDYASYSHF